MPKVGNKEFPYTQSGVEAAQVESKTTGIPVTNAGNRSQSYQIGGQVEGMLNQNAPLAPIVPQMPQMNNLGMYEEGGKPRKQREERKAKRAERRAIKAEIRAERRDKKQEKKADKQAKKAEKRKSYQEGDVVEEKTVSPLEQYVEKPKPPPLQKDDQGNYYTVNKQSGHRVYYDAETGEKKTTGYKKREHKKKTEERYERNVEARAEKKKARKTRREEKRLEKQLAQKERQRVRAKRKTDRQTSRKEKKDTKVAEKTRKKSISNINSIYEESKRTFHGDYDSAGNVTEQRTSRISAADAKRNAAISALDE